MRKLAPPLEPKWWSVYLQVKDSPPEGHAHVSEEAIKTSILRDELPPGIEVNVAQMREIPKVSE